MGKRKQKFKKKQLVQPVYPVTIYLMRGGGGYAEITKRIPGLAWSSGEDLDCPAKTAVNWETYEIFIYFNSMSWKITPGMIAHECSHVTDFVFHGIGHDFSLPKDEPRAYFMGWLVDECHQFLKKV